VADVLQQHLRKWLRPEWQKDGALLRSAVRLNEVNRRLPSGLDGFEYGQAQVLLEKGQKPTEVVRTLRKQRQRLEVKYNLERVKAYLERPLTADEEKKVRAQLEKRMEVADIVAGLGAALAPERQSVPGGIRLAVQLDEVAAELEPGLDGREYLQARNLLQQNARPAEVVMHLAGQRAENFEKLVVQRQKEVRGRLRFYAAEAGDGSNRVRVPQQIYDAALKDVQELLRRGGTVEEVARVSNDALEDASDFLARGASVEDVLRLLGHRENQQSE
jgi:hypothetical protein